MSATSPRGMAGACLRALAALGGRASTTEIRVYLAGGGACLAPGQVRIALHSVAARRKVPLAELAVPGAGGYGRPGTWRLTAAGRAVAGDRVPCGTGWPGRNSLIPVPEPGGPL